MCGSRHLSYLPLTYRSASPRTLETRRDHRRVGYFACLTDQREKRRRSRFLPSFLPDLVLLRLWPLLFTKQLAVTFNSLAPNDLLPCHLLPGSITAAEQTAGGRQETRHVPQVQIKGQRVT